MLTRIIKTILYLHPEIEYNNKIYLKNKTQHFQYNNHNMMMLILYRLNSILKYQYHKRKMGRNRTTQYQLFFSSKYSNNKRKTIYKLNSDVFTSTLLQALKC